jgi:ABC-type uncharacterized transport system substrate-binding protein
MSTTILKGKKAIDLPSHGKKEFETAINLKIASMYQRVTNARISLMRPAKRN